MFAYLFKPYSIRKFTRESYLYSDKKEKRRVEVVVCAPPYGSEKYELDDVSLTHWLSPEGVAPSPEEKATVIARLSEHLGGSVLLISSVAASRASANAA